MDTWGLKKWLLAGLAAVCLALSASEEYYDFMKRVEAWLKEQYSEAPLTYKARQKELAAIVDDEKMSEAQKIALMRQKFPKVFTGKAFISVPDGQGVPTGQTEAEKLQQGDAEAQFKLGQACYAAKNYPEAVKWYRKAAAQGNQGAVDQLKKMGVPLQPELKIVPHDRLGPAAPASVVKKSGPSPMAKLPSTLTVLLPDNVPLVMRKIPAGSFLMGSPINEMGRESCETQHRVTISKDFYIGVYEITEAQYEAVVSGKPNQASRRLAKTHVQWWRAMRFCDQLNNVTSTKRPPGLHFTLPTEAQWEYACRAGTKTSLNSGKNISSADKRCRNLDRLGWNCYNSPRPELRFVGQKSPNAWGLYDMHGNVWEHCLDGFQPFTAAPQVDPCVEGDGFWHVLKGGCHVDKPFSCRSARRIKYSRNRFSGAVGLRVVLVPDEVPRRAVPPAPVR